MNAIEPVAMPSRGVYSKHYTTGGIESIDYIRAKLGSDHFQAYCIGNVIKYVSRYSHKNGLEDLKKAQVYLTWAVESLDRETQ